MDFNTAINKIKATADGSSKVIVEYHTCDFKKKRGGVLRTATGNATGATHGFMEHGTVVIKDDRGEYHTIHTALIMRINNEFVD